MNYVLVGDIHSQAKNLESALSFIEKNIKNARIIFLGDLFDSKHSYSDSFRVYKLVRESEESFKSITLQSNHQDKLIRYLKGNNILLNNGLDKTIEDLQSNSVSTDELYNWLIRHPFGFVFRDAFGQEFRCAHAYFSSDLNIPNYQEYYKVQALTLVNKHQFLYGMQDDRRNRINWWDEDNRQLSFIRVAGHYKTISLNLENKSLVLDSRCGDLNGVLSIYDVNSRKLYHF